MNKRFLFRNSDPRGRVISSQATKTDLVDLGQALGAKVSDRMTVPEVRTALRAHVVGLTFEEVPFMPEPNPLVEPKCGWADAMVFFVRRGLCPWCSQPIVNITINAEHGCTWSCLEGCNP